MASTDIGYAYSHSDGGQSGVGNEDRGIRTPLVVLDESVLVVTLIPTQVK
jgi:hypothetical protein